MPSQQEIHDTALTMIEERGAANARAWAIHCATRDTSNFWNKIVLEIDRQTAAKIFAEARAKRAAREATRDPVTKRLP